MQLSGVFPPMPTPFDSNGDVDPAIIRSNIPRWLKAGVRGVVALGTNGEAALLDEDESERVVAAAREAIPRSHLLIAGTGRESTRATITASRRAAAAGADAVLVRTPSFYKARMTADVLIAHYSAVADASSCPLLLYNYPAVTGVTFSPEAIARLSEHPNIVGMKETSTDAGQMGAYITAAEGRPFELLAGSAPGFFAALCLGATGGILAAACVVPRACVALHEAFKTGDLARARDLQARLMPIAHLVTSGYGIAGLKLSLDVIGGGGGHPRPPLLPVGREVVARITSALAPVEEFL